MPLIWEINPDVTIASLAFFTLFGGTASLLYKYSRKDTSTIRDFMNLGLTFGLIVDVAEYITGNGRYASIALNSLINNVNTAINFLQ